jgi:DNA-binding transcriptional MerR regulator/soluble P-type ATPase
LLGLFAFGDEPKPTSAAAIARLKQMGLRVAMLSGDSVAAASAVAARLGIDEVRASLLPEDKSAALAQLKDIAGGDIAMVGDGVNDAPALAAADLGIAMGPGGQEGGTDAAMQTAGITLMRGDPLLVADAIDIARATDARIRQNLIWAFVYNIVGIPLAAFGLLDPVLAGAAMALSSVSVLANALLPAALAPDHHSPGAAAMNIGQASGQSGVSAKMIRYYESIGLMPEAGRTQAGYRVYSERDVHCCALCAARATLASRWTISACCSACGRTDERPSAAVKDIALKHIDELTRKIAELQAMKRSLLHLAEACHGDDRPTAPSSTISAASTIRAAVPKNEKRRRLLSAVPAKRPQLAPATRPYSARDSRQVSEPAAETDAGDMLRRVVQALGAVIDPLVAIARHDLKAVRHLVADTDFAEGGEVGVVAIVTAECRTVRRHGRAVMPLVHDAGATAKIRRQRRVGGDVVIGRAGQRELIGVAAGAGAAAIGVIAVVVHVAVTQFTFEAQVVAEAMAVLGRKCRSRCRAPDSRRPSGRYPAARDSRR